MPIERQPRGEPIGLRSLEFSQIPDRVFDYWLYHLTGAQFKILAYICRRTYGFKKDRDAISLDQICNGIVTKAGARLDWGTGLSREGAIQSLKRLEDLGLVLVARTEVKETNQHFTTKYQINIVSCSDNEGCRYSKGVVNSVDQGGVVNSVDQGSQLSGLGVVNSVDLQDTVLQDTDVQHTEEPPLPPKGETTEPLYEPSPIADPEGLLDDQDADPEKRRKAFQQWITTLFREVDGRGTSDIRDGLCVDALSQYDEHGRSWVAGKFHHWYERDGRRTRDLDKFARSLTSTEKPYGRLQPISHQNGNHKASGAPQPNGRAPGTRQYPREKTSAPVPQECAPPPEAAEWNKRVQPPHRWMAWDCTLDSLWREATGKMNGHFQPWLDRCAELSPAALKHSMGSAFTLKRALAQWSNVLNGDWNWLENNGEKPEGKTPRKFVRPSIAAADLLMAELAREMEEEKHGRGKQG